MNTTQTRCLTFAYVAPSGVQVESELPEPRTAGTLAVLRISYAYNARRIFAALRSTR